MDPYTYIKEEILLVIQQLELDGFMPADLDLSKMSVESPRDPSHGDVATNIALILVKQTGMLARDMASELRESFSNIEFVESVEVAGPGFINFRLSNEFWQSQLSDILDKEFYYGDSNIGQGEKVNLEYVSTNPTGPLHIGHVRGAVYGDALAKLLTKVGYKVTKEYYVNDAGAQIDKLVRSVHLRYLEALGEKIMMPDDLYPGDYLIPVGELLAEQVGDKYKDQPEENWLEMLRTFCVNRMMTLIMEDLASIGISHDQFIYETYIHQQDMVEKARRVLTGQDLLYIGTLPQPKGVTDEDWEPREQLLFKSTDFGDDEDRALQKEDGEWTYFAADMGYHLNKIMRGYNKQIVVLGADHGGYVKRLQAAVQALSLERANIKAILCQMVTLDDGSSKLVKFSKRGGKMVMLKDMVETVGSDAIRFSMLTRKTDAQLVFDFEKVVAQTKDNPVYYVQYAVARINSVFRKRGPYPGPLAMSEADFSLLTDPAELDLIKLMASWPRVVESAALLKEPHKIAFYLNDLASAFHYLWNKGNSDASLRFNNGSTPVTVARLAMITCVHHVIESGLEIIGIQPIEEEM